MGRSDEHPPGRHRLIIILVAVALGVVGIGVMLMLWKPLPERSLVMAGGARGGPYDTFARDYGEILARQGVELRVQTTAGSRQNGELLRDPGSGVDAAFVLGGTMTRSAADDLVSLGSVFYEPVWFFCRCDTSSASIDDLPGPRISIGPYGSGSRDVALDLFELNGVDTTALELLDLTPAEAADSLAAGKIDAAILTAAWEAPAVQRLLLAPHVRLVSFSRADAYVALYPFLTMLKLPMGVASLALNRPPEDVVLVAFKANLVVRRSMHPALQYLLVEAATETHGRPGIFQSAGQFPAAEEVDLPLSPDARHYYRNGPSLLQRQLPFWMAEVVQRLLLLLIPLVGILYPLATGLPKLYQWQMRRRIYRLYGELKWIERELQSAPSGAQRDGLMARLAALDSRVTQMRLPNAFAQMSYLLKQHVRMLREGLERGAPDRVIEAEQPPGRL